MADTKAAQGLTPQQWNKKYNMEYIQDSMFAPYITRGPNSVFQVDEDLTKEKGDSITFALVNRLQNDAVVGDDILEGNEEAMKSRSHRLFVDQRRNATVVPKMQEQKSAIDLLNAAKPVLMDWSMEDTRDLIIDAMMSVGGTKYEAATAAVRNEHLSNNVDRYLFGNAKGNTVGSDFAASLANVASGDRATADTISLMKRMALSASPKIKPIRVMGGKRYFVAFAHPLVFRDLKKDPTIVNAQKDVVIKNQNNRLFQGGDIEWDGVIVHEVDDMPILSGVGSGTPGIDVSPIALCGAQALGIGWAQRWEHEKDDFDYKAKKGVSIGAIYGVDKLLFGTGENDTDNPKQNGIVLGYAPAIADA